MNDFAETINVLPTDDNIREWLERQMKENNLSILLAFADDGIIWGRHDGTKLTITHDANTSHPELRGKTLQEARAFNKDMEIRLFRDELGAWKALRVVDGSDPTRVISESQILWGDKTENGIQDGFVYASEYRAGIQGQWLPLEETFDANKCARLEVRHLVDYDEETGEAYIAVSRLAGLSVGDRNKEV